MIDNVRVYSSSRPVIPQRLRRSARVYKASGGETTSFGLKDLHSTHADMKILICCALFAAVALCSAAPPERHPPAEQEQVADFYDAIFIVPRPDLASLGPTNSHTSTDGTGFGGSGSFSLNLFGILKSALGIGGGYGDGSHTASADTDAASGGPINSDRREEHHSLKSIEEQRVDY